MYFNGSTCSAKISLPEGVDGEFVWNGTVQELTGGKETEITA